MNEKRKLRNLLEEIVQSNIEEGSIFTFGTKNWFINQINHTLLDKSEEEIQYWNYYNVYKYYFEKCIEERKTIA